MSSVYPSLMQTTTTTTETTTKRWYALVRLDEDGRSVAPQAEEIAKLERELMRSQEVSTEGGHVNSISHNHHMHHHHHHHHHVETFLHTTYSEGGEGGRMMQQQDENDITATKVPSSRLGGGKGGGGDNTNKERTRTARRARKKEARVRARRTRRQIRRGRRERKTRTAAGSRPGRRRRKRTRRIMILTIIRTTTTEAEKRAREERMRESYRRGVNRAGRATTAARWIHRNGDEDRRVNRVCATRVGRGFAEQTFWHRFQTTKITINRITTKITQCRLATTTQRET